MLPASQIGLSQKEVQTYFFQSVAIANASSIIQSYQQTAHTVLLQFKYLIETGNIDDAFEMWHSYMCSYGLIASLIDTRKRNADTLDRLYGEVQNGTSHIMQMTARRAEATKKEIYGKW